MRSTDGAAGRSPLILPRRLFMAAAAAGLAGVSRPTRAAAATRFRGVNLIETATAPFGTEAAARSLRAIAALGANSVALIPFLWQASPEDPAILYGDALPPERLRAGIRQARAAGLRPILKPHVWVPERWAGTVRMRSEGDWAQWFAAYRAILIAFADLAREESVEALVIGTELRLASARGEWHSLIDAVRARFAGRLSYVAHGFEEAEQVGFWSRLDAVAVSLYPPLGADRDRAARRRAMDAALQRSADVAAQAGKPLWIAEIGLRSAVGAAARPWESAEERVADPDPALQASVLGDWLDAAERRQAEMVLVWRWFTDPDAGGMRDTDFTIQNKPAAQLLRARWLRS